MTLIDPAFTEPEQNWRPCGSFQQPVAVPASSPDAGTLLCLPAINQEWLPLIIGCIDQMLIPATWGVLSDAAMVQVLQWVQLLKLMVSEGGPCMQLRWSDADCAVEQSTDGGSTWTKISGWPVGPPACFVGASGTNGTNGTNGANGTNGTNGTNGVTPQLRWSGCSFQVSTDGGATWANLSGFDLAALGACLSGAPGNPQSVSTPEQACNIAAYLADVLLAGSMSKAAAQLGAGASLADAGTAILAVAAALTGVGALAWLAVGAFFLTATGIGQSSLSAAAGDATLKANLKCAIYAAIIADGHVTASNFAAVASAIGGLSYGTAGIIGLLQDYVNALGFAGINAVQGQGALYAGDCSSCSGVWCFHFDFTTGQHGWTVTNGLGVYVAGVGFRSTIFGGSERTNILRTFTSSAITSVRVVGTASDIAGAFYPFRTVESDTGASVTGYSLLAGAIDATVPWAHTAAGLVVTMDSQSSSVPNTITDIYVRGTGTCPFGTPNCS